MTLSTTSPGDERDRLHGAIMNIPCHPYRDEPEFVIGYKMGHRDARHAAAELVSSSTVQQVGAETEAFVRDLLWNDHPECCGCPVVGAEYMGAQEMICCGNPEPALLNDKQIVASLRARFPVPSEGDQQ